MRRQDKMPARNKKLLDKYKNKPLDEDAVKKSYKIFTKGRK